MMRGSIFIIAALVAASPLVQAAEKRESSLSTANPIRKVVNLLKSMASKVEAEGAKGQELYDKFMCYCKTGKADLEAGIASAGVKLPAVASSIKAGEASMVTLKAELKQAQMDRSEAKAAMAKATALRTKEATTFAGDQDTYDTNIKAIKKAVGALENGLLGSFLQTGTAQVLRKIALDSQDMEQQDRQDLLSFLSGKDDSEGPSTGEVVGILKQMGDTMAKDLAALEATEAAAIKASDELMASKGKEVDLLTSTIERKMGQIGELGVEIAQMKNDLTESEAGLMEDKQFLADLEKGCSTKAAEWQEAEKMRAEELKAISEVIKMLNDDDSLELFKKTLPSASASLVQVKVTKSTMREQALALLRAVPRTIHTDRAHMDLITLALRGKTIGFEKVTKMIDAMVETLKKEQLDDDHKKEYCDGQFDTAEDKKKGLERSLSDETTAIADAEEGISSLTEEIKALEAGIKALDKAVAEATEQRKEEAAEYSQLLASDSAAKELLGVAKNRLNKFYNPKLYSPPAKVELSAEDRIDASMTGTEPPTEAPGGIAGTGITVFAQVSAHAQRKDAPPPPPEAFEAYSKKSEDSQGVVSMIDLLIKDLDKELQESEVSEKDAQAEYETMMKDSAEKRAQDSKTLTEKQAALGDMKAELENHKDTKYSTTKELMAVEAYIASLHGECDWLVKYYDVRAQARNEEIDNLGKAKAVLSGADYSLLQTKRANTFLAVKK